MLMHIVGAGERQENVKLDEQGRAKCIYLKRECCIGNPNKKLFSWKEIFVSNIEFLLFIIIIIFTYEFYQIYIFNLFLLNK